ncbi:MAG TPA: glycosyltransferase family 4 protein [Stellaceae bacterium]|nr:glycosyltransferase family 4 protein [Stellaceae bacterium]
MGRIRRTARLKLALLVPGSIDQLTGGYLFARHVVDGLRDGGDEVAIIELAGEFPGADAVARAAATAALASLPDGAAAVIDGLALLGFADCLAAEAQRLKLIGFIHHPLADESGLAPTEASRLRAAEHRLLPLLRGAICPSRTTAAALLRYGLATERIAIVPPGTVKPAAIMRRDAPAQPLRLLAVATITPRKGHRVLIEALAQLDRGEWQLDCIGSTTRDPVCVAALHRTITAHGLDANVRLVGEMPPAQLVPAYDDADLFVLASFHEGYGMAFAEALAHGLPIVATCAGAIPDTVPESAGLLVPPGDIAALTAALGRVVADRALLARLSEGARRAGAALPDWPQAVAHWRAAVMRLLA